jgi:hypothetical protein
MLKIRVNEIATDHFTASFDEPPRIIVGGTSCSDAIVKLIKKLPDTFGILIDETPECIRCHVLGELDSLDKNTAIHHQERVDLRRELRAELAATSHLTDCRDQR